MINCPNCGAQLTDDSAFCTNCGVPLEVHYECSNCHGIVEEEDVFCVHCGASFTSETAKVKNEVKTNENKKSPEGKKKKSKLPLIISAAVLGIALIVAGIFLVPKFLGGKSKAKDLAVYVKEKEINFSNLKEKGGLEVTKSFVESGTSAEDIFGNKNYISYSVRASKDGKLLFYPDKSETSYLDDYYPLYFCETDNPTETAEKIDSNVAGYVVNENASTVTYIRNDRTLYQYDVQAREKNKLNGDVRDLRISDDGKKIVFTEYKDDILKLYYLTTGEEKVKIDSDIYQFCGVTKDYNRIYYIKNNTLYLFNVNDENKEKISGDVVTTTCIYERGEVYYITSDTGTDENSDYSNSVKSYTLNYFDGNESEKIGDYYSENYYTGFLNYSGSDATPMMVYCENEKDNTDSKEYFIAVGKNKTSIGDDKIGGGAIGDDGICVYYCVLDEDPNSYVGDLFRVRIVDGKAEKPELYDKEVYAGNIHVYDGENVSYFKEMNDNIGELYFNRVKVQYDVFYRYLDYDKDSQKLYYIADYDKTNKSGKLEVYSGDKPQKISDDVMYDYIVTPQGNVLFMKDYSTKMFTGDLYYYDGESRKIDEDVICLVNPWN